MPLSKVTYVDGQTIIGAANLNAIQDEIIANGNAIGTQATAIQNLGTNKADVSDLDDLSGEVSELKSSLNKAPEIKDSTEQDADLDISDPQGNVIMRLANGHIKTKNFDSQSITSDLVKDSTETGIDLDVSDAQGNVILRLKNGELATKWFSSENIDGSADYNVDVAYSNAAGSATIEADFHCGDTVVLHFADADDRITGRIANYNVTYSYTAADGTSHTMCAEYGYKYPEYTFPEDAVSVTVTYGTSLLWGESGNLRFSVYKKGLTERIPHIIKVALDGSGDYTSLRSAVDSITDNNAYNRYQIEVHPGTYEILSDYTDAEISETGFKGLFIGDGLSLVGIGQPGEVVLHGTLDTSIYSSTKRNDVSVINIAGNARLENLTINAENMRYCVHDDTSPMAYQPVSKEIKNCVLNAHTMTTRDIAYGCGISGQRKLHIVGCVFNQEIHLHTHGNASFAPEVILENCEGSILSAADYNSTVDIIYSVRNCKFSMLSGEIVSAPHQQYLFVNQIGGAEPIVECEAGQIYNLSNCIAVRGAVSAGQLVNVSRGASRMTVTAVATKAAASGVSIGAIGENTIVASGGYINSNQVGLSGLSAGEYITIDSDGTLTGGGTESNAVGVVKALSTRQNGGAYIKLFV